MIREVRHGMEVLDSVECARLLGAHHFGRVAVVHGGEPIVLPINYVYDGGCIVFCTGAGTKLDASGRPQPVAFEIDAADSEYHTGWSVLVRGAAELVTDPDDLARVSALPLRPWVPRAGTHWVRIRPYAVTGRRIPPP